MKREEVLGVLESGVWGTVGPVSLEAARDLAGFCAASYALLTHSSGSALEAVLRGLRVYPRGRVLIAAAGSSLVRKAPRLLNAEPVISDELRMVLKGEVEVADVDVMGAEDYACIVVEYEVGMDVSWIVECLTGVSIPVVLYAGGRIIDMADVEGLYEAFAAVVYSFGEGSHIYAGSGGAVVTNNAELYSRAFAVHNCGREPGDRETLVMNEMLGGDMRITEFQALAVRQGIESLRKRIVN